MFRAALNTEAYKITDTKAIATTRTGADRAKEAVPEEVRKACQIGELSFGRDYIILTQFDPRSIESVSARVAEAAGS